MHTLKNLFLLLVLLPLVCLSQTIEKPQLIFKVNTEALVLDNSNIKHAYLEKERDGSHRLNLEISARAAERLNSLCAANIRKTIYLYFGKDKLIAKSIIQSTLGNKLFIPHFPEKEAKELINSLQNNHSR